MDSKQVMLISFLERRRGVDDLKLDSLSEPEIIYNLH